MSDPCGGRDHLLLGLESGEPIGCVLLREAETNVALLLEEVSDVALPVEATNVALPEEALLEKEHLCEDGVSGSNLQMPGFCETFQELLLAEDGRLRPSAVAAEVVIPLRPSAVVPLRPLVVRPLVVATEAVMPLA